MSAGNILQYIGTAMMFGANLMWFITGIIGWKKPMPQAKAQKFYDIRKADRIMTFAEWLPVMQSIATEASRISVIIGGIGMVWIAGNAGVLHFNNRDLFHVLSISGTLIIMGIGVILSMRVSKRRYGIQLRGVGSLTTDEVAAFKQHQARAGNQPQPVK